MPYVPGGQSDNLSTYEREVVDSIIAFYGGVESTRLPDLSHGLAWNEILQEFSQAMISGAPTPRPPLQPAEVLLPNVDLDGDVDEHLASPQAKEIEQDWWETFRILADR
ncbi:hypothetical protein [Corynebacterium sp. MSK204]|uniref:hypothetical protein n=1 Tax=Corynebacterium sp. MSK204 TaxID=3050217 RepID=UPI002549EAF0|nr:hypothetical protein [Corynebacterium sp. MSK204]MDK8660167.1 hypothetical protein [Corynebacterium sp. MSK204]